MRKGHRFWRIMVLTVWEFAGWTFEEREMCELEGEEICSGLKEREHDVGIELCDPCLRLTFAMICTYLRSFVIL